MKYNKPEIVAMSEAVRGIQTSQTLKTEARQDNVQFLSAPAAYEADE